ncbi:MAG TPA: tagaturonate epimerase family protein, partial [Anaerolineae bacterium]|nr:tagaturonate epimerase family protein [Anaerolineae bacterium]
MTRLLTDIDDDELAPSWPEVGTQSLAAALESLSGWQIYPRSIVAAQRSVLFLGRQGTEKYLGILSTGSGDANFVGQTKSVIVDGAERTLQICPTSPANAAALRAALPFLVARPLGLRKSAGCGDRLG